jgi:hypothetical protein
LPPKQRELAGQGVQLSGPPPKNGWKVCAGQGAQLPSSFWKFPRRRASEVVPGEHKVGVPVPAPQVAPSSHSKHASLLAAPGVGW